MPRDMIYLESKSGRVKLGIDRNMGFHARFLSWRGGPNLIDDADNGRGFQTDLIEGWPDKPTMGNPYCRDAVNATQGGSIEHGGTDGSTILTSTVDYANRVAEAVLIPRDYCRTDSIDVGLYRKDQLSRMHWPDTNWELWVHYAVLNDSVELAYVWFPTGGTRRYMREVRSCVYLNKDLFSFSLDEAKRDWDSWQAHLIRSVDLRAVSADAQVKLVKRNIGRNTSQSEQLVGKFESRHKQIVTNEKGPMGIPVAPYVWIEHSLVFPGIGGAWMDSQDNISGGTVLELSDYNRREMFPIS